MKIAPFMNVSSEKSGICQKHSQELPCFLMQDSCSFLCAKPKTCFAHCYFIINKLSFSRIFYLFLTHSKGKKGKRREQPFHQTQNSRERCARLWAIHLVAVRHPYNRKPCARTMAPQKMLRAVNGKREADSSSMRAKSEAPSDV